ncbi:hypothetical protein KP014_28475 [Paenibacillus sophorae]|nr:hypothetical protein [Paenibacillus sophorae]QWU15704.1 hypothetical protein KP014_28475 [Paenibacillus sophorae]
MREVTRLHGVSGLLSSLKSDIDKRHSEDRMRCWRLLLPIARAVVWEEYVRYGETLDVYTNLDDREDEVSSPFEPVISAQLLSGLGAYAEWHTDPMRNEFSCWDREVRG